MTDDSEAFPIPHRQHFPWPWYLPSWLGLPHCCGEPVPRGLSIPEGGCKPGAKWREEAPGHLSVHPKVPHACFHGVRRLNVQCGSDALEKKGLGLGPWLAREPQVLPASGLASVHQNTGVFFLFLGYNSIKQCIWMVEWCRLQLILQREICFTPARQFDNLKVSSMQALGSANSCENKTMRGRLHVGWDNRLCSEVMKAASLVAETLWSSLQFMAVHELM